MIRILIIGQGLAGTALAWRLHERGVPFVIVDREEPVTCSKVAAGLITPVTGMRLKVSWRFEVFYPEALRFYRNIGKRLGRRVFFPRGYVRLLKNEQERQKWPKRLRESEVGPFVHPQAPQLDPAIVTLSHEGFQQRHAAWLDTVTYLEASRRFFGDAYRQATVEPDEVIDDAEGVVWRGERFSHVVWAQGWQAAKHPLFDWVPFQSALGTILTAKADLKGERRILNRGCWVIPRADGTLRAGSTYEWSFPDPPAGSPSMIADLETKLRDFLAVPVELVGSQSAVRPIIKGRQALLGAHPSHPRVVFFNGLGSKGSLRAPWLARHLAEHLLDGRPLDPEFDLQANDPT
ncbi:MAG: FAD-binding oxidoreductase [Verrucomicrobiaceae bacterium]|nr:FAD-binding oxidoreductase [Verrucomicrobiaceae bacterium]